MADNAVIKNLYDYMSRDIVDNIMYDYLDFIDLKWIEENIKLFLDTANKYELNSLESVINHEPEICWESPRSHHVCRCKDHLNQYLFNGYLFEQMIPDLEGVYYPDNIVLDSYSTLYDLLLFIFNRLINNHGLNYWADYTLESIKYTTNNTKIYFCMTINLDDRPRNGVPKYILENTCSCCFDRPTITTTHDGLSVCDFVPSDIHEDKTALEYDDVLVDRFLNYRSDSGRKYLIPIE
jgi:hypothetical protein